MKSTIKGVIFDCWETLGTKGFLVSEVLQKKFDIPQTPDYKRRYEEAVQLQAWKTEEEMAKSFLAAFSIEQNRDNKKIVIETFAQGLETATLYDGMYELLVSLKKAGLALGVLSNATVFESAVLEQWRIRNLFAAAVFSCYQGVLKPSPVMFDAIISELNISKDEVLYIDDTKANIDSAKNFGMQGVLFKDVETLRKTIFEICPLIPRN